MELGAKFVMGGSTATIVGLGWTERRNGDRVLNCAFVACEDFELSCQRMPIGRVRDFLPAVATITVTLDPAAFGLPSHPDMPGPSFTFTVAPASDRDLLSLTFAICNSYPEEMHCHERHAEVVGRYRGQRLRSLSMGDTVTIEDEMGQRRYRCAFTGWDLIGS